MQIKSTIFNSSSGDGSAIFLVHLSQAKDRKAVASLLSYFKTLCNGPVQEIAPTTSRSVVKRSPGWASPAAVQCDP